jgi:cytoskeletal protein CcmA (bactofilin family)
VSMWGKRQDEPAPKPVTATPPKPAPPTPSPVEVKKEAPPLSSNATFLKTDQDPHRASSASIGKAVKIVGQIFSREDLYVDGDVEGTIELLEHKLTVGPNGKVQASIKAREVVALGAISGNVEAHDRLEIRKDAKLVGDIRTARIIIEDGAYFKGSIDIVKPEPVKQPAGKTQAPAPAAAVAQSGNAAEAKR